MCSMETVSDPRPIVAGRHAVCHGTRKARPRRAELHCYAHRRDQTAAMQGQESDTCKQLWPQHASGAPPVPAATVAAAAVLLSSSAASAMDPATTYVPSPYEPGWEVWVGAAAGVIPFLIASWEFGKRIVIQRRCLRCQGSGLVPLRFNSSSGASSANSSASGTTVRQERLRKCPECGGFLPWLGWRYFWLSNLTPGNGGFLLQPRGQTGVFYKVPPKPEELDKTVSQAKLLQQQARQTSDAAAADEEQALRK